MAETKAKNKKAKSEIKNKPDSLLWGFIAIIPFGWIVLWANINHRRSEVEKGLRTKDSAIKSIDNYASGVLLMIIMAIVITATLQNYLPADRQHDILIINFVAIAILVISSVNNKHRIRNLDGDTEDELSVIPEEDIADGILSYDKYIAKVNQLKSRLESIDIDNPEDKEELLDIRKEIDDFFELCKDAEFDRGGKYKLYELKSEYYFVMGDKVHAKEYIEEAAKIKREEDNRKK